jgi:uncharacterized protein YbbK (DUF523 family)/uncharacterized protein YbgA (DUF1722 family)
MRAFPRPRLLISACLEFRKVRYDGKSVPCGIVRQLMPYADFLLVCPEYEIGLGVPRDPIRLVMAGGEHRMVQPKTGRDVTGEIDAFTDRFMATLPEVDGFIFKSKSPTIGINDIKVYQDAHSPVVVEKASGLFARKILAKYPDYPIEEDERLNNAIIRYRFLTRVFAFAGLREASASKSEGRMEAFHEDNRLLYLLYDPVLCQRLEEAYETGDYDIYSDAFRELFTRAPDRQSYIRVTEHLLGLAGGRPDDAEQRLFRDALDKYGRDELCLEGLLEIAWLLASRCGPGMERQTIFEPFPPGLMVGAASERSKKSYRRAGR